jgi:hypothetical protein
MTHESDQTLLAAGDATASNTRVVSGAESDITQASSSSNVDT